MLLIAAYCLLFVVYVRVETKENRALTEGQVRSECRVAINIYTADFV